MSLWISLQSAAEVALIAPGAGGYRITIADVALLFFVMLGPVKSIGAYFAATRALDAKQLRTIAWKSTALSWIAIVACGIFGSAMLGKWHISPPAMQLAGGVIFLVVALRGVLTPYRARTAAVSTEAPPPKPMQLVYPMTVTPHAVAALVLLLGLSEDIRRYATILVAVTLIMVLNLLGIMFVRPIMKATGPSVLQILGVVLSVLQTALAIQILIAAGASIDHAY
jgi:multiple antibiotic resistance protein